VIVGSAMGIVVFWKWCLYAQVKTSVRMGLRTAIKWYLQEKENKRAVFLQRLGLYPAE